MKHYILNDGTHIPWLAFGTGTALYAQDCSNMATHALGLGFTHLDTAQSYKNEDSLGVAIDSFLGSSNDEAEIQTQREKRGTLYVTTKLGKIPSGGAVEGSLRESLRKLRLDYVDLFLVHNPRHHADRKGGLQGVWHEMVEVKRKGLTRSIGVSNFNRSQLEEIVSLGLDVPAVNQIEYHPFVAQTLAPLIAYHNKHSILTASYAGLTPINLDRLPPTISNPLVSSARTELFKALHELSDSRGCTSGQLLLKWLRVKGTIAVTTSTKEMRLREYLGTEAVPDLTESEMKLIEDAVGDAHFRAFTIVPHMDNN